MDPRTNIDIKEKDLIYIAAFWEAEGSLSIHHRQQNIEGYVRNSIQFDVTVSQQNPSILYWIKDTMDCKGGVYLNRTSGSYQYKCSCKSARKFLKLIFPYVKFRHKQIIDAWKYWKQNRREVRARHIVSHSSLEFRKKLSDSMRATRSKKFWNNKNVKVPIC